MKLLSSLVVVAISLMSLSAMAVVPNTTSPKKLIDPISGESASVEKAHGNRKFQKERVTGPHNHIGRPVATHNVPGRRTAETRAGSVDTSKKASAGQLGNCDVIGTPSSKVYHIKGTKFYDEASTALKAGKRECFPSEAAAMKAGFRKAKV